MAKGARARKELRTMTHGWFFTPDRPGDRTLEQQIRGLEPLFAEVVGKQILDVGCAEGLISLKLAELGAANVYGIDIVGGHIAMARRLAAGVPECVFEKVDANEFAPARDGFAIVLMLAVLHKLREPAKVCRRIASACSDLCVIRMGPNGLETIVDGRSQEIPQDIGAVMRDLGFVVERKELGPFDEVTWYYRRQRSASVTK